MCFLSHKHILSILVNVIEDFTLNDISVAGWAEVSPLSAETKEMCLRCDIPYSLVTVRCLINYHRGKVEIQIFLLLSKSGY